MAALRLLLALLLALTSSSTYSHAIAPSCQQVAQRIRPCAAYLSDLVWAPYGPCCNSLASLNQTAMSPADRFALCNCLKSVAPRYPMVDLARAAALPVTCGISLNFTLSPTADCSRCVTT